MHAADIYSKTLLCDAMQVAFFCGRKIASFHFRATELQLPMTEKENQQKKQNIK